VITSTNHEPEQTASSAPDEAAPPLLSPKLGPQWALGPIHVLLVIFFGLLYLLLNYLPLRGTDLWGHALYGRWMLEHRALPAADPFLPLASGMPVLDAAWLSQVLFALVDRSFGAEALSHLFALTVLATYLVLARVFYLQSRSALICLLGSLLVLSVGWSRLTTIRPENLGALCFAVLLWLIVSAEGSASGPDGESAGRAGPGRPWRLWLGVPLVMVCWTNLHGSFVCGLAVLACWAVGSALESAARTRSLSAVTGDRNVRGWLYALELGVLATLVNPYGIDLLLNTLWFSRNENLRDILEWQPMVILGVGGREFAVSLVLLMLVIRHSRVRFPLAHGLMLGLFALSALFGIRMLTWYAAAFAFVIVPHLAGLLTRIRTSAADPARAPSGEDQPPLLARTSLKISLICVLLAWIAFGLSPLSTPLLGGARRTTTQLYGESTPVELTAYLRTSPPEGQIFNPQWWGDWLIWDGPPGLQAFVTSNVHLLPRQVWRDYMSIMQSEAGWMTILGRYRVNTVILDKNQHRSQSNILRRSSDWRVVYQDKQAIVFRRVAGSGLGPGSDAGDGESPAESSFRVET